MDLSARARFIVSIALIAFGLAVTWAAADGLITGNTPSPRTESSNASAADEIAGAAGQEVTPRSDVLGAFAESSPSAVKPKKQERDEAAWCTRKQRCSRDAGGGGRELVLAATWAPGDGGDGQGSAPSCADTHSCVDRVVSLLPDVPEPPLDLPKISECTSSIGGDAICFDFGGGNYLVGDGPEDGQAEFGFCTTSGYYFVSGPKIEGGAGAACPDDDGGKDHGNGHGDTPAARDCTSSIGGDATCFDFGGGKYLVIDALDDGEGELGFCTSSGYYYYSAPAAQGDAGAECPDAPPAS